ncbi:hypothetical protein K450DRAFT_229707 [Umbelopsis ramanniana AG]|uniref:Uncharacterized protein n=1 Tax=Umbelopsis ramanniana AG TaxID=1314678 RepID=A0AAD5EDG9_UMBRA|nr:uncharacterized protein K450DRAFT_229707 [Umbelopsis ramanniana AG]KAI8581886.1 hypothetical protein K450DRAFT_229707 [Umbelopsis ramanniana AG]
MSCQTCTGCFTGGGCSTKKSKSNHKDTTKLESILVKAESGNPQQGADHDHTVTAIAEIMSKNIYSSQMALFSMYDKLPYEDFLKIVRKCYEHNIQGPYIAWLWEYTKGDAQAALKLLVTRTEHGEQDDLWKHLEDQAELHQAFGGSGIDGKIRPSPTNVN